MNNTPQRTVIASFADLERALEVEGIDRVDDVIYAWLEFDGDVVQQDDGIELALGRSATGLIYPFFLDEIEEVVDDLESRPDPED